MDSNSNSSIDSQRSQKSEYSSSKFNFGKSATSSVGEDNPDLNFELNEKVVKEELDLEEQQFHCLNANVRIHSPLFSQRLIHYHQIQSLLAVSFDVLKVLLK